MSEIITKCVQSNQAREGLSSVYGPSRAYVYGGPYVWRPVCIEDSCEEAGVLKSLLSFCPTLGSEAKKTKENRRFSSFCTKGAMLQPRQEATLLHAQTRDHTASCTGKTPRCSMSTDKRPHFIASIEKDIILHCAQARHHSTSQGYADKGTTVYYRRVH